MMRKMFTVVISLITVISASVILHAAVIDKIVVVINNEVITQNEIDRLLGPLYHQFSATLSGDELMKKIEEARQAIMAQLIDEKLILSEAKKLAIEVDDKDVLAKVEEARKRFPSITAFEQALASQGISMKDLKTKYKEQLMAKKLIDQKVGARIFMTPNEVSDYYAKHIAEFSQPEVLKLSNILIRPKDSVSPEKTAELVLEIGRRLKEGGDFAELARIYSEGPGAQEGGSMGYVGKGDLLPEIEKVVFNMKQGEVSGVIRTKLGYHFFKLDEKKEARAMSLSEVRKNIEQIIWMEKMKEKSKGWIEDLRKHAYIAFK